MPGNFHSSPLSNAPRPRRAYAVDDLPRPLPVTRLDEHESVSPRPFGTPKAPTGTGLLDCIAIPNLRSMLQHRRIDARTLVVFDIDLTLTMHSHVHGAWHPVPVEENTVRLVRSLQDCGVPVLGLTARAPHEAPHVLETLRHLGIDLRRTSPLHEGTRLRSQHPSRFEEGVIFTSDYNSKGDLLAQAHSKSPFAHALMIDDNPNNFLSLGHAAKVRRFDLTCGYYLGALGGRIPQRNSEAWYRVQQLSQWGSDANVCWRLGYHAALFRQMMAARRDRR